MSQIICNKIQTPDGTVLESRHRHDYKVYTDTITGETYMVDGGKDYLRRNDNKVPATDLTVYAHDAHELIRESFTWGSYGKDADEVLHYIKVMDMADDHINAVIKTQVLVKYVSTILHNEMDYRKLNNIEVTE